MTNEERKAIVQACREWRDGCFDGPLTHAGQAMQRIYRVAMGDPKADLWDRPASRR